jgi:amidophosphoribosyltransferase
MSGPKHSCGVVGISATYNVVPSLQKALMIIQHRGQESAGISVFANGRMPTVRDNGLVQTALSNESLKSLDSSVGIGHVRYSTTGSKCIDNAQPLTSETNYGCVALAHNGDITNYPELKRKHIDKGTVFKTDSDSELVIVLLSEHMEKHKNDPVKALQGVMSEIDGSYALSLLIGGRLFGIRDPYGLRPLCIGRMDGGHVIVSESSAVDALGAEFVRDVSPGEIVEVRPDSVVSHQGAEVKNKAYCMFEWVYFARPDSVIDGSEVYEVRKRIGMKLAKEHPADVDVIMPIPDSGRAHAIGFSIESHLPYEEGFMKNRFAERTFILPNQSERELAVSVKMNPIKSTVAGKRLVIVDDSIVRGTTMKKLVSMLRQAGAKEVHVRVGSPPIIAPCYYGVDMKSRDQFVANNRTVEEIGRAIGADSIGYISIEGLVEAIGKPDKDLCLACVNGKYPTRIAGEANRFQSTLKEEF